jgi:MFS family permease
MQSSSRRYYTLAVATLGFVALGVSLLNYPTISTLVSQQFGLSNTESGLLTSAFALTYTVIQIPAGLIADRIGGAKTLLISLSVVTVAPLVFISGNSFDAALLSRAIAGAGAGMILPADVRLLSSSFSSKELHRASGILGTGWGGSQVLAYLVLPLLIVGKDWHPPLEFTVILSLAIAVMAILPVRWGTAGVSSVLTKVDVRGLVTRRLIVLVLPNFTSLVVTVGLLAWMPAFLTANLKLNEIDAGQLIAIVGVAGMASSLAGGILSQRIGPRPVVLVSMVLLAISPYFIAVSGTWLIAAFWMAMLGIGGNLFLGPVFALVPYSSAQGVQAAGFSFGIFNTLSNVGGFLSPIIIGYTLDVTGSYLLGFTALGVIGISGIVGALLIRTMNDEATHDATQSV